MLVRFGLEGPPGAVGVLRQPLGPVGQGAEAA